MFQVAIYVVFHEESESAVRIDQFLHPEEKTKKNQPTRVSISYRKISYHTSPPYFGSNLRFPDIWRCALGGFLHAEFDFAVKNN